MDKEVQIAIVGAVGTVAGSVIGAIGGWYAARTSNRMQKLMFEENLKAQRRQYLDNVLLKWSELQLVHPHFEEDGFCHTYPDVPQPAEKSRYEAYCMFIFNFLSDAHNHFAKDEDLHSYIGLAEILKSHHRYWQLEIENLEYNPEFRQCIQNVIDKLRKEGKLK